MSADSKLSPVANWRPVVGSFIRYAISGGVAFFTEYATFYVMYVHLKVPLVVANGLSFCFGLVVAFLLNRVWAFEAKQFAKKATHQFGFYLALAVVNLMLTLVIVAVLKQLGVNPKIGKLVAMIITSSWNFLLLRYFIFAHASKE